MPAESDGGRSRGEFCAEVVRNLGAACAGSDLDAVVIGPGRTCLPITVAACKREKHVADRSRLA